MRVTTTRWTRARGWSAPLPAPSNDPTLVLAFGHEDVLRESVPMMRDVMLQHPYGVMIGCSTAGQITGDTLTDEGLVVSVASFSSTRLSYAAVELADAASSRDAGRRLGAALAEPDLRGLLVLSDGTRVNGTELVAGLAEALPGVPVSGGLAGDADRFGTTYVLVDGEPRAGWVTAVGFVGADVELGFGSRGGWDIFGPERQVTRSVGNVLYELDGRPALSLYKEYLGERAEGLPATALLFPLSVSYPDGRTLVRTVLSVDETRQSMTFAGDIPQGARTQLMMASTEGLLDGANVAASTARLSGEGDVLAVAISCVGRRLVLGERSEEELDAVLEGLGRRTPLIGFYSYGELSPTGGMCDLHNQTMTVTTIRERP